MRAVNLLRNQLIFSFVRSTTYVTNIIVDLLLILTQIAPETFITK